MFSLLFAFLLSSFSVSYPRSLPLQSLSHFLSLLLATFHFSLIQQVCTAALHIHGFFILRFKQPRLATSISKGLEPPQILVSVGGPETNPLRRPETGDPGMIVLTIQL